MPGTYQIVGIILGTWYHTTIRTMPNHRTGIQPPIASPRRCFASSRELPLRCYEVRAQSCHHGKNTRGTWYHTTSHHTKYSYIIPGIRELRGFFRCHNSSFVNNGLVKKKKKQKERRSVGLFGRVKAFSVP